MKTTLLLVLVCVLSILGISIAQIPIPRRYDGFSQGDTNSPILFEMFADLLCPDCKQAWPNIKDVLNWYNHPGQSSNIRFYLHTFPLPYHHNAFFAAQGLHGVSATHPDLVWDYVDTLFNNQELFWDDQTASNTANDVISFMGKIVETNTGFPSESFIEALNNDTYNENARISWKYACSRGVPATPWFFINGILIQADPSWTVNEWRMILDPLFTTKKVTSFGHRNEKGLAPNCPSGKIECDYLPGKFQCCLPGERCVPNVGCRC